MHALIALATCWVASATSPSFVPLIRIRTTRSNDFMQKANVDSELAQLTVPELKDHLRKLNLPVGGRKQQLIDRLDEHHSGSTSLIATLNNDLNEPDNHSLVDELDSLTVPVLKERLKLKGLPVGGRKQDLIERLRGVSSQTSDSDDFTFDEPQESTVDAIESTYGDDEVGDYAKGTDLSETDLEDRSIDDTISRRAKRKKYFKTQEVRELIRANDPRAPQKAEEMIAILEVMANQENNNDYLPGPKQYTTLIDAYAKSDTRSAEEVIERIMKSNLELTTPMMNAIMGAYVNMGTLQGAKEATTILERMEYTRDFGGGVVKPTVYSYSLAISAWAKCRSVDAATSAENILSRLLESYEKISTDGIDSEYAEEVKPNSVVFNGVIDAWANSGSSISGEKAEELLNKMECYSRMDDHHDIRPDTITFNTCIKAWCNSNHADAAKRAEELLCKLEKHPEYPKRNGVLIVRPNLLSYNTVINSWAKSSSPDSAAHAEALLTRMLKKYKAETFSTIKPDVVTFSSVLNALAKSKVPYKAEKCLAIIEAMIDLHEEDGSHDTTPNVICFNTILNACAFSARGKEDEKKRALRVAVKIFKILNDKKYARPDAVSYGNMLKCCANLMPPGNVRTSMASTIFSACCEEGLVGGMVLDEIRRSIPSKEFNFLLANCGYRRPLKQRTNAMSIQLRQLPPQWTANVRVGDMQSRQRGVFVKPKIGAKTNRSQSKANPPVVRRPGFLVEPSWASGKDV